MQKKFTAFQRLAGYCVAAACFSTPLHAEPDAMQRSAPIWQDSRINTLVVTALGKYEGKTIAVGERGLILVSDEQGKAWRQVKSPVAVTLTGVSFSDANTVWVVGHGGIVLRSADGGETWSKQLDGEKLAALALEAASSPDADPSALAEAQRLVADGPDKPLLHVNFFDKDEGLLIGAYGLIFSTEDGGANWKPLISHLGNRIGAHLYGVLKTGKDIWIAGEQGSLFLSEDAGRSYRAVDTPYQGSFFGVAAAGSSVLVFGMRGNAYYSEDRGASWHKSSIPSNNSLTAGYARKNGAVVLVDDGGNVFESSDGGKNFYRAPLNKLPPLTSVIEAADGEFVFGSARGIINSGEQAKLSSEVRK